MCASNDVNVCIERNECVYQTKRVYISNEKKEQWRLNDNRKSAVRRINNDSSI